MAVLTVGDLTPRAQYTATSGQTVFSYNFPIFEDSDILVYIGSTLQTITTDYTVSGAGTSAGGNVTLTSGASAGDVVTIYRDIPVARTTDYATGGALLAENLNDDLDRLVMMIQQVEYDLNNRCLRFGQFTTGIPLSEFTESAADRANKVLSFSSTGDPTITQELGVWNGNWATSTAYVVRDLVKDTSNNNVYICLTAHTSSGSQPISTNTDSAKWALLIDAATATSSATAAAASATAAASSASAASTSETNAATSETNAASSATSASSSASSASTSATNAANSATSAANDLASFQGQYKTGTSDPYSSKDVGDLWYDTTNKDLKVWNGTAWDTPVDDASASATSASSSASSASTSATTATTQASAASTSATNAATSETNAASSASSASTSATNAASSATAAAASAAAAAASADAFDDTYLGAKASDPTVDNDGDALTAGDMYFNTTTDRMRVYDGSSWSDVALDASTVVTKTSTTGSAELPVGTTAQRDGTPSAGYMRFNTTDSSAEIYDGTAWGAVGGGNTTDEGLYEHAHTISANYSITSGNNALSASPVTINSGVSVTIPSGSTWVLA